MSRLIVLHTWEQQYTQTYQIIHGRIFISRTLMSTTTWERFYFKMNLGTEKTTHSCIVWATLFNNNTYTHSTTLVNFYSFLLLNWFHFWQKYKKTEPRYGKIKYPETPGSPEGLELLLGNLGLPVKDFEHLEKLTPTTVNLRNNFQVWSQILIKNNCFVLSFYHKTTSNYIHVYVGILVASQRRRLLSI